MARRSSILKPRTRKGKYTALYVASSPCYELPSVDDIAVGVRDLVRGGPTSSAALPRLTLTVSGKGFKVVRHAAPVLADTGARRQRRAHRPERGVDKVRHSLSDIVLVGQGVDSDVRAAAALVLHGFDSDISSWLHVHVYWFDDGGPETAARFVRQISELIDTPQHRDDVKQLENRMIASGQIRPRSHKPPVDFAVQPRMNVNGRSNKADKYVRRRLSATAAAVYRQPEVEICRQNSCKTSEDDCKWPESQSRVSRMSCSDLSNAEYMMWSHDQTTYVDGDGARQTPVSLAVPTSVASLASELKARLATGAPILLPPKDYDTVTRSRGNLNGIEDRRCVNVNVVGGRTRRSDTNISLTYL